MTAGDCNCKSQYVVVKHSDYVASHKQDSGPNYGHNWRTTCIAQIFLFNTCFEICESTQSFLNLFFVFSNILVND